MAGMCGARSGYLGGCRCVGCKAANSTYEKARYRRNPGKKAAAVRAWQLRNPVKVRGYQRTADLKSNYGIDDSDYEGLLKAQGGGCAICGAAHGPVKRLAVDHDHDTLLVRGILCSRCNPNVEWLIKFHNAIQTYLGSGHRVWQK